MRDRQMWRPRVAATAAMCVLVGMAIALHGDGGSTAAADPHAGHIMPRAIPVAVTQAAPLPATGWAITADNNSAQAANVLDGDAATLWRTTATKLPHLLTIDTRNRIALSGLTYLPPDSANGRIGRYEVLISDDGTAWSKPVATGTFADDATLKTVTIETVVTRFVRLRALSEAGGRSTRSAAAEINLLGGTDPALSRTGWTATADSQETASEDGRAQNVLDGDTGSIWHTRYSGGAVADLPHVLTIDMKKAYLVSGLSYLPRPADSPNGHIGQYQVSTSTDGSSWSEPVAGGTFADSEAVQSTTFSPRIARFVRLQALTEAGDRGPWSSAAEINVLGRTDPSLSRTGWTVRADSEETAEEDDRAAYVLDGDPSTLWHSAWSSNPPAALPHTLTIDMKKSQSIGGLTYLPRPDDSWNGHVGNYQIATSTDGKGWTVRISSAFPDTVALQTVVFPAVTARYVRLTALTEAGGRGPWSTAAEIKVLAPAGSVVAGRGAFSAPIGFPLVPVAAAQLPNGKILTWSAFQPDEYVGGYGRTVTATYDPATGVVTQRTVTTTGHDMFCPGISTLPDGRILVTGGNDSEKTSIYDPRTDAWTRGPEMNTPRGYQASTTLSDGRVFTIGGSWSGGYGGIDGTPRKNGEVWSAAQGWISLPGTDVSAMLTDDADARGDYRKDNHAWLFAWTGGSVLQAGPSRKMNWYGTAGAGTTRSAGTRGDAPGQMNGDAVMYDTGKILAVGGSPSYEQSQATANAYVLTINGVNKAVTTKKVAPMANTRSFANAVPLPDGTVAVFGGQNYAVPFSDNTSVRTAELWDPKTEKFTALAAATVPRNYHSVALLMPDGRVFTGGGGLCGAGCDTNHFDGQVFTPPYLLNADGTDATRPVVTTAPATAANGAKITIRTGGAVTSFAIIRMGTATHTVDTDQRRLSLTPTAISGGYRLTIPSDPGVALPGYWMLFALTAKGVPSVAKVIKIG